MKKYSLSDRQKWYKSLPKKHIGVGLILRNKKEQILLLKTNYLENKWSFPGGGAEQYESPEETIKREVYEEIGLRDIKIGNLLLVHTTNQKKISEDNLILYFDGGFLTDNQIQNITIQKNEILEFNFFDYEDIRIYSISEIKVDYQAY